MGEAAESVGTPDLVFRPPTNPELQLIKASWLYATPSASKIAPDKQGDKWVAIRVRKQGTRDRDALEISAIGWHQAHAALRDRVLSDQRTWLVVAALRSVPGEAVGWACCERSSEDGQPVAVVWWVHVVGEARGRGIGSELLRAMLRLADEQNLPVRPGQMTTKARPWWKRVVAESV